MKEVKIGKPFEVIEGNLKLKIMAVIDDYVMARFTGRIPFVKSVYEFEKMYKCKINLTNKT